MARVAIASWVERSGSLWFGTVSGAALYEPARVPPQTVITSAPPALSANTLQNVHFLAAYREVLQKYPKSPSFTEAQVRLADTRGPGRIQRTRPPSGHRIGSRAPATL